MTGNEIDAWVLVEFLVVALAVFRVWVLVSTDSILNGARSTLPDWMLSFLACPWCSGFWLSIIGYLVWINWSDNVYVQAVYVVLALSAAVGIFAHAVSDPHEDET